MTTIIGAGLAGLIAGHIFPNAKIIEREPEPRQLHNALLRFRSEVVSVLTGIPFRKVRVHKSVWHNGGFVQPDPWLANQYSIKVTGKALSRSIWDLNSVDRFIAPPTFYDQLMESMFKRIEFGSDVTTWSVIDVGDKPFVSTMPMPTMVSWLMPEAVVDFKAAAINVQRFRLRDCDVHQTVYVPGHETSTYRVSVTGETVIVESMDRDRAMEPEMAASLLGLLSLYDGDEPFESKQNYGKIAPINEAMRREIIHQLSAQRDIYSLGRFGTWRNILLDDVVQDARIVKQMIDQESAYERRLTRTRIEA